MRATDLRFTKTTIARIENARERLTVGQLALRAPFRQNTVVNELIKRRSETEWFIEGDFKAYVSHMKQSHLWGVEPELVILSRALKYAIENYSLSCLLNNYSIQHIFTYLDQFGKVVNELINRQSESEWFIEGDFKAYVSHMKQSHLWGVEPELVILSHVLKYIATTTFYSEFIRLGYQASSDLKALKWNYEKKVNALRDLAARETLEQVMAEAFSIFIPTDPVARETLEHPFKDI
ncbi:OTU domain-containing protein-like protein isoform X1 [Tanacetum coccineum]|uniref:OTU domain-containing protein-like protein isoform X1 n=1 Tax=Tanacetum coccineum TaxID=301880 RepID=A0ABQ5C6E3_9ASTR